MALAMQGTPWDSKGKLATLIPMMGGTQATPATATAESSGGAEGSTYRVKKVDKSLPVEVPEDVPEEGEQDVEGALTRPEKRARRRPRKRVLLDISHPLYFAGCSAYQHLKGCLRLRQNILTFAARVGMTPEQVQLAQDKGLLPEVSETTSGSAPTAAASGVAAAATSTASGAARAVSRNC
eukprot:2131263-Amphidinium_carterae.1